MTEAQMLAGCRRGDRDAQRELYVRTSDRIYGLLLRMTRNRDDAFDLAQETYLRAFDRIEQFDGSSSISTWLYRIAVNEALQCLRRRKLHDQKLQQRPARDIGEEEAARDDRLDVDAAVARLPEFERALVVLRYFEGLDYAEMARVLEKPSGTIASGLNRARQMLRELLGDEIPAGREESRAAVHPRNGE